MYKIIGGDQKEYGPVTFEQVSGWIRDNRANAQTLIQKEGGPWVPLGSLPEFASLLPVLPAAPVSGPTGLGSTPESLGGPLPGPPSATPYAGVLPDGGARARAMVQGPATALLVTGILCIILSLIGLVMSLTGAAFQPPPGEVPPELRQFFDMMQQMQGPMGIVSAVISFAVSALVIYASQKLRALQSFALVVTATILAMFPCTSPCCCIGIPVGIWVLVVVFKPEVKSAFQ
jgi:hypothetical protein